MVIATEDTEVRIDVMRERLELVGLRCLKSGFDWIDPRRTIDIPLVATADVEGRSVPLSWKWIGGRRRDAGKTVRWIETFENESPRLVLHSVWRAAPGPGPVEHQITITSKCNKSVELPLQTTLRFQVRPGPGHVLEQWWVEKGAGHPTSAGTHCVPIGAAFESSLVTVPYTEDDMVRDAIPWTSVYDRTADRGWYAGIEFSGRVRQLLQAAPSEDGGLGGLSADFGLAPEPSGAGRYRTRLAPGQTFETPTVFVGCYEGGVDDGGNRLRRWIGNTLRPRIDESDHPLLTLNSWGSGMAVDEHLALRMANDAAGLGLEMLHIDAGWFRSVGDWRPDPAKFPRGLTPIVDHVHALGLKFGLWVGWTQGGVQPDLQDREMVLDVHSPDRADWFAREFPSGWKPSDFIGADLCLADPRAAAWCETLLERIIREYKLDMLEHDQRMVVDSCIRTDHLHTASSTDIAYHAARGYYRIYDSIRGRHPDLVFEDCVNGGRMVDYGILRRASYISITDVYGPLDNRQAFFDASYALPPARCECYVADVHPSTIAGFKAMLRSGMMGWCTIMCDTTHWTPEQHAAARRQFDLYKSWLRPLIVSGDFYHVSERPDGKRWDGVQYVDPGGNRAVLMVFRGVNEEASHRFYPHALAPDSIYWVSFEDGLQGAFERSGAELMERGVSVDVEEPGASQIVLLDRQE